MIFSSLGDQQIVVPGEVTAAHFAAFNVPDGFVEQFHPALPIRLIFRWDSEEMHLGVTFPALVVFATVNGTANHLLKGQTTFERYFLVFSKQNSNFHSY